MAKGRRRSECVCVCVCVCVCMYRHVNVCVFLFVRMCGQVCVHVYVLYACVYTYMYICMCVCVCVHAFVTGTCMWCLLPYTGSYPSNISGYWTSLCSIWVCPNDEPNTSKKSPVSGDIGWVAIQLELYLTLYALTVIKSYLMILIVPLMATSTCTLSVGI